MMFAKRFLVVVFLLTALASVGAGFGQLRDRRGEASSAVGSGPAPQDIFERYAWDLAFDSKDLSGPLWPSSALGSISTTLVANGTNATANQSTSGLLEAGLGASRVDKAVVGVSGNNAYSVAGLAGLGFDANVWWIRFVQRRVSTDTQYIWRAFGDSTTGLFRFRNSSAANCIVTVTSAFTRTFAHAGADAWTLVDFVFRRTGGAGGVSRIEIFINGVDRSGDHTGALTPVAVTEMTMLGATPTGAVSVQPVVWWSFRASGEIDLAQHRLDAAALGVYTP